MRLFRYNFLGLCLLASPLCAILPLRDQWHLACQKLAAGHGSEAHQLFTEFHRWYGEEPVVTEPEFAERLLRYRALAALQANQSARARQLIEQWFTDYPDPPAFGAFMRFQLANLCHLMDDPAARNRHWQQFLLDYPHLPEAILVHWQWADLSMANREYAAALQHLQAVLQHPALSDSAAVLAHCAIASVALLQDDPQTAYQSLQNTSAGPARTLLRSWRGLLAPDLANHFLQQAQPDKALQTARWLLPPAALANHFRSLLPAPKTSTRPNSFRRNLWQHHWHRQWQRFHQQLAQNAPSDSAAPPFALHLLRLRALAGTEDFLATRFLAENLLLAKPADPTTQAIVWTHVVRACQKLKDWEAAARYASSFLQRFPDHPEAPRMLFLNARSAVLQQRFPEALELLRQLLQSVPQHPARPRWQREYATALLQHGQPAKAFAEFKALRDSAPEPWDAFLTLRMAHCQNKIQPGPAADQWFASVADRPGANRDLREAALFGRLRNALAANQTDSFLSLLDTYHARFPHGRQRPAVQLMAGGFHQRQRRPDQAATAFQKVYQNHPAFAVMAADRLLQVYRQNHDATAARSLFSDLLTQLDTFPDPLPESVFQVATWACSTPSASAIPPAQIRRLRNHLLTPRPPFPPAAALRFLRHTWPVHHTALDAPPDFSQWHAQTAAAHTHSPPVFAAFQLFKADWLENEGRPHSADTLRLPLLDLIPPSPWPPDVAFQLAQTARRYDFPDAPERLRAFLERFPQHPDYPQALFLLAGHHHQSARLSEAANLLQQLLHHFPDAPSFLKAGLLLTRLQLDRNQPRQAAITASRFLQLPHLSAPQTARLLLLRARADAATNKAPRAALACQRILTLYPAFPENAQSARRLLEELLPRLPAKQQSALKPLLASSTSS